MGKPDVMMGYGDYHGTRTTLAPQTPTIRNTRSKGGVIIRHREFIQDINSSVVFQNINIGTGATSQNSIQPGNPNLFPWLSQIAANFELWAPRGIMFEFRSTSTDTAVNTTNANPAIGAVIMATEYNTYNAPFANKQQMESYEFAVSCKPSCSMLHAVETKKSKTAIDHLFVRTGAIPTGADARLYDLGSFQIAASGMQTSGFAIGELWVTYEIEFQKPRLLPGVDEPHLDGNVDHFNLTSNTAVLPATPFGTDTGSLQLPSTGSTLGGRISRGIVTAANQLPNFQIPVLTGTAGSQTPTGAVQSSVANTYYFPQGVSSGRWMLQYTSLYGTQGTMTSATPTYINCAALTILNAGALGHQGNVSSGNTVANMVTIFVTVTAAYAAVSLTQVGGMSVPTYADLIVTELPFGFN